MQYRKKPVVIDAWQFNPKAAPTDLPDWIWSAMMDRSIAVKFDRAETASLVITTREGAVAASSGDWIIRGVEGEIYPCKPDIFAKTYERVSQPATTLEARSI